MQLRARGKGELLLYGLCKEEVYSADRTTFRGFAQVRIGNMLGIKNMQKLLYAKWGRWSRVTGASILLKRSGWIPLGSLVCEDRLNQVKSVLSQKPDL